MEQPPPAEICKMRTGRLINCSAEPDLSCQGSEDTVEPFKPHFKRQLDRLGVQDCYDDSHAKKHKTVVTTLQMEVPLPTLLAKISAFDFRLCLRDTLRKKVYKTSSGRMIQVGTVQR